MRDDDSETLSRAQVCMRQTVATNGKQVSMAENDDRWMRSRGRVSLTWHPKVRFHYKGRKMNNTETDTGEEIGEDDDDANRLLTLAKCLVAPQLARRRRRRQSRYPSLPLQKSCFARSQTDWLAGPQNSLRRSYGGRTGELAHTNLNWVTKRCSKT